LRPTPVGPCRGWSADFRSACSPKDWLAPYVGDAIERRGGGAVLAASALLLAAGLLLMGLAPNLPVYVGAWLVLGLGMGAGLYDAEFSTLGRLLAMKRAARSRS
jgi:MFS family permease